MYFTRVTNLEVGDAITLNDNTYPVLWVNNENGVVMVGIMDTPFVSSNYASFKDTDMVKVSHPNCAYCVAHSGGMMPSHYAMSNCKSGKYHHCTCDTCF